MQTSFQSTNNTLRTTLNPGKKWKNWTKKSVKQIHMTHHQNPNQDQALPSQSCNSPGILPFQGLCFFDPKQKTPTQTQHAPKQPAKRYEAQQTDENLPTTNPATAGALSVFVATTWRAAQRAPCGASGEAAKVAVDSGAFCPCFFWVWDSWGFLWLFEKMFDLMVDLECVKIFIGNCCWYRVGVSSVFECSFAVLFRGTYMLIYGGSYSLSWFQTLTSPLLFFVCVASWIQRDWSLLSFRGVEPIYTSKDLVTIGKRQHWQTCPWKRV